jgi:hypothetical protein
MVGFELIGQNYSWTGFLKWAIHDSCVGKRVRTCCENEVIEMK